MPDINVAGTTELQNTNIPVNLNTEVKSANTDQDPPSKKLWEKLTQTKDKDGIQYFAGSFEDFKNKYSTNESIDKMFNLIKDEKITDKDEDEFYNEYYPDLKKNKNLQQKQKNGGQEAPQSQSASISISTQEEKKEPTSDKNITQEVPKIKKGEKVYRVDYFDTNSKKMSSKLFPDAKSGELFQKSLTSQEQAYGTKAYYDKYDGEEKISEPIVKPAETQKPVEAAKPTEPTTTAEVPKPKYIPEEQEEYNDSFNLIKRKKALEKDIESVKNGSLFLDKNDSDVLMGKYASVRKKLIDNKVDENEQAKIESELEGLEGNIPDDAYRGMMSNLRQTSPGTYYNWIGLNKATNLLDDESYKNLNKLWDDSKMGQAGNKSLGAVNAENIEELKTGLSNVDSYLKEAGKLLLSSKSDNETIKKAADAIDEGALRYVSLYVDPETAKNILSEKMSGVLDYKTPKPIPNEVADPNIEMRSFGQIKYDPTAPKYIEQKQEDFNKDSDLDNYSLESIKSKLDPNSRVDQMVFNIYSQKKGIEDAFIKAKNQPKYGNHIADAAVNYAISINPDIKKYYDALGEDLPKNVVAQITDDFLSNPSAQNIALKSGFLNDFEKAKKDFYKDFPEYSKNKVALIISQRRENDGENNGIINLPSQESVDNTVQKLKDEGVLDEDQTEIYKNEIRSDLSRLQYLGRALSAPIGGAIWNANPIQSKDFAGGISEGYAGILQGIKKTSLKLFAITPEGQFLKNYTDIGSDLLSDKAALARMMANNTVGKLQPTSGNAIWHSIGSFTGMAAGLALGGAEFKALGLSIETAGEAAGLQAFLGEEYEKALYNFPGNTTKDLTLRGISTLAHTAIMTMGTKLLPINKATEGLASLTNSEIDNTLQKFASGEINLIQAKKSIGDATLNFLKKAGGNSLSSGTVLTAINAMDALTGKLLGENTKSVDEIVNEAVDNYLPTVLSTAAVSGFAALGTKDGNITAKNIFDIANNPDYYLARLDKMVENNPKIKNTVDDIRDNINVIAKTNEVLSDKTFDNLSKEQKIKYLFYTLQENAWRKKAASTLDSPTAQKFSLKSQEFAKAKEDILNNKDKATELTKKHDKENIPGVSGEVGVGEKPVTTEPKQGAGAEETGASGVLQTPGAEREGKGVGEKVGEVIETKEQFVERKKAEILSELKDKYPTSITGDGINPMVVQPKYMSSADIELAQKFLDPNILEIEYKAELPQQKGEGVGEVKTEPIVKFSKKENVADSTENIVDEMNMIGGVNIDLTLNDILNKKGKLNLKLFKRKGVVKKPNVISIADFNGIPVMVTISDELTTGQIVNPITGEIIGDLKGGIGFNYSKGNTEYAWAYTNEKTAKDVLAVAKKMYEQNPQLYPDGIVPVAVVKMGKSAMVSNEAIIRQVIQNLTDVKIPEENKVKAFGVIKSDIQNQLDVVDARINKAKSEGTEPTASDAAVSRGYKEILKLIDSSKSFDELLKNVNKLNIGTRPLLINRFTSGDANIVPADNRMSIDKPATIALMEGLPKSEYKRINLGHLVKNLTDPSLSNVPDKHIISFVGIDAKADAPVKIKSHPNYPYALKGKGLGVLEETVHIGSVMPAAYGNIINKLIKAEESNKQVTNEQMISSGLPAALNNEIFRNKPLSERVLDYNKLVGYLQLAFPNSHFFTDPKTWEEVLSSEGVKKYVKEGEVVYGLTKDGHIYLNPNYDSLNTLVHEVGHLHIDLLENTNPLLFNKGISLVEGTDALKNAIKEYGEDGIAARKEALAILIGNKGESIADAAMKSKFKEWLVAVYKYIQSKFPSLKSLTPEQIADLTLDEFINGSLKDILGGKEVEGKKQKEKKEVKFSKEKAPTEPELPKQKEEETGISKAALKDKYGFVQTFDVKSDQEVADNAMNNLATSATKNKMSLDEQAENDMLGIIDKTGEASEQDIMTAAYYLNSLDKKIEAANENGENANVLLAKRAAALEILRKLGNNAGRNLRLFGNVYKNVEGNKLEAVKAELKKNLGISDIPSSVADLKKSKLSEHDKELIKPYVEAIEKLNTDLNDIKTKLNKEKKTIDQAELEDYIKKELENRLKQQSVTPPPAGKKARILQQKGKEWADKIRVLKIQKGQTPLDVTFGLRNLAIEAIAQIVEGGATIAEAIRQVLLDKKFASLKEDDLTDYIIKSIDIAENKDISMAKIKEMSVNANSQTIIPEMVSKGHIKNVVDAYIHSDVPYDQVIKEATNELKSILPEVTEKEVTDALLKRGEFKPKTKKQLENEAKSKMDDIKRLEKSKSELEALEAGVEVAGINKNNKLSAEQKKKEIEKRKSDFEKDIDEKIAKIEKDKKEADKKAEELKKEKDKADAEAKKIKDRIATLTKQLNDIKAGIVKVSTPKEKEAPEIEDLKQKIKDALKDRAEKEKIDRLTKKLNDLRAGIITQPTQRASAPESQEVQDLKKQIKDAEKALRTVENERKRNIRNQRNINNKLKSLNEQIQYVKNNKRVFNTAINDPKKANEQIKKAQEQLKDAYNQAGIRLETGNKNEIKIAQDAENAIKEIEENDTLPEDIKKEHIEEIKAQRDKDLQGTKQSVLTSLKDGIDGMIQDIKYSIDDAIDRDDVDGLESLKEIKMDLDNLSANLSPTKENLKDQIDKSDQDLTALINYYKGTEYENDLRDIQQNFRDNWQKTSDDIQRQMIIDKEERKRKEIERKINAGQYTEIPITPFDAQRDNAAAAAEAETKKAWNRLNSLSIKAKEQQETKGAVAKWLKFRRDWMIMTPGAIGKVAGSAISKPIIDPAIRQTFGRISGSITGLKPINFTDFGKSLGQIKSEEDASKYVRDSNENYIQAYIEHKQAVREFGEDSKEAKSAKEKLDDAELTKNSAIAFLFINANSKIDIGQIMIKGATDFDASMGKYKQSFPSERTKMQNSWYWVEAINRTHSAMKSISHRQALMEEFMENLQYVQGRDGTITEQGRQEAWDLAVLRSEAGRFGEDTWASNLIGKLKGSEKGWVRNIGNWTFPVAKVGINITKQGLDMAFPGMELAYKAYHENIINEFDKLPLQQKKYINTLITRGLFGLAQYAIVGYLLASGNMKYGGAYNPEDREKVMGSDGKVLEHGQWEIGGVRMPEAFNIVFNHSPYCLPASVAAMGYQQSKKGEYYKAVTGIVNEVYERLPFQATADIIAGLTGKKYKLETIVANEVPTMKGTAEFFDKDEEGNTRQVKTSGDNFVSDVLNKIQSRVPGLRNLMEEKPVLFKDSEIESSKELSRIAAAGIQLPDISTKEFAVAPDAKHPNGEMTPDEKAKFVKKVKANYLKEVNGILNEKWEGTDQKTGQVVVALGTDLSKFKGDIKRATTAIQEMSNQALTKSWTNAYKEMGLEKAATTEYKWEKAGDVLFDDKKIQEIPDLQKLKDAGVIFNKIEAKSDIETDNGEMTDAQYETYKKEFRQRALSEIREILMLPEQQTQYLRDAKQMVGTSKVVSGVEGLSKVKVEKNGKEISLLQDRINSALSGLKNDILIDMKLITPKKSWKKLGNIPDMNRGIDEEE